MIEFILVNITNIVFKSSFLIYLIISIIFNYGYVNGNTNFKNILYYILPPIHTIITSIITLFIIILSLIITKFLFNFNVDDNYLGFIFFIIIIAVYIIVCCYSNHISVFKLLDRIPIMINTYDNILRERNNFLNKYNENIKNINNYLKL
jgi:hypothetical protein